MGPSSAAALLLPTWRAVCCRAPRQHLHFCMLSASLPPQEINEADGIQSVHDAFRLGINFFDTSPFYGNTKSEQVSVCRIGCIPIDVSSQEDNTAAAGQGDLQPGWSTQTQVHRSPACVCKLRVLRRTCSPPLQQLASANPASAPPAPVHPHLLHQSIPPVCRCWVRPSRTCHVTRLLWRQK